MEGARGLCFLQTSSWDLTVFHDSGSNTQVLTWLEANARRVTARADGGDPLIQDCATK